MACGCAEDKCQGKGIYDCRIERDRHGNDPAYNRRLAEFKDKRIAELEAGLRRAIHLAETIMPIAMWPDDNPEELYGDEWAHITLGLVREALGDK